MPIYPEIVDFPWKYGTKTACGVERVCDKKSIKRPSHMVGSCIWIILKDKRARKDSAFLCSLSKQWQSLLFSRDSDCSVDYYRHSDTCLFTNAQGAASLAAEVQSWPPELGEGRKFHKEMDELQHTNLQGRPSSKNYL